MKITGDRKRETRRSSITMRTVTMSVIVFFLIGLTAAFPLMESCRTKVWSFVSIFLMMKRLVRRQLESRAIAAVSGTSSSSDSQGVETLSEISSDEESFISSWDAMPGDVTSPSLWEIAPDEDEGSDSACWSAGWQQREGKQGNCRDYCITYEEFANQGDRGWKGKWSGMRSKFMEDIVGKKLMKGLTIVTQMGFHMICILKTIGRSISKKRKDEKEVRLRRLSSSSRRWKGVTKRIQVEGRERNDLRRVG
jgi:hypothetical protein